MSEQLPKTGATLPSASKKKAPAYELVVNETGAMRRVPVKGTSFRPSIAAAAIAAAKPVEEEELVFNETGELTGEAKKVALESAKVPIKISDEEELVFTNEGEVTVPKTVSKERKPKKAVQDFAKGDDLEKMKAFYRLREKNPNFFQYTAEGNLEIKPNNPAKYPPGVIPLRAFSALRPEELEEIEMQQRELQAKVEGDYVVKMRDLRAAYEAYRLNPRNIELANQVVRLNEEMRELSVLRNKTMYPERWIHTDENPDIRSILLYMTQETRKLGYDAYLLKRFSLSRQDAEGHYRAHGEALGATMGGGTVVLFITSVDDPKTGVFHPTYETEFVYNETKYASPYQAYETERFKMLGDELMVKKLLGTRSAKTIKQLVAQEVPQPNQSDQLWMNILEALYSQNKELEKQLKDTESARFHMMDKQFASPEYANALVTVRTKLKERENDAPSGGDMIKQSVISEDEQKKAKVGAIIHNTLRRRL